MLSMAPTEVLEGNDVLYFSCDPQDSLDQYNAMDMVTFTTLRVDPE